MKKAMKKLFVILIASYATIGFSKKAESVDKKIEPAKKVEKKSTPTKVKKTKSSADYHGERLDELPDDAVLVDQIHAIVFAQEGQQIITSSDAERPSLEGKIRTLDEIILEKLMYLDGMKFKMQADDETIDKHLALIQRENNMTLDDLKKVFSQAGYSYEEGRQQFGVISVINQVLDFKIRSRLIVPDKEVSAYYHANPERQETAYYLQRALIPYFGAYSKAEQQEEIELFINEGKGNVVIEWQEPFWRNESELPESKHFITLMEPGSISMPQRDPEGFELFKLIEKKSEHLRSLDERYREISDILRKPRYEKLFNEYKKQLFDNASIVYFD